MPDACYSAITSLKIFANGSAFAKESENARCNQGADIA